MRGIALLMVLMLTGCSSAGGPFPSLQPRPGEQVDPRLPVERPMNDRPVTPALAARLEALVAEARAGDDAFAAAIANAEKAATSAGPAQSEGWIAAQEALSAAISARKPVAEALAGIDALGADKLQVQGGLSPNDLAAIQDAASTVGAIDRAQAARIDAIQQRLGI
jgi:hypothetical protein